jgi:predicted RNA-binding Zn-ribbon protein involved in translation (DUF1610 family)
MGAFNTVTLSNCPSCGHDVRFVIQFKFGDTYQRAYSVGDELKWGGNDIGPSNTSHVVVDGVAETPCPSCGSEDFYLHVERDRLVKVEVANGRYDFVKEQKTFIVLED